VFLFSNRILGKFSVPHKRSKEGGVVQVQGGTNSMRKGRVAPFRGRDSGKFGEGAVGLKKATKRNLQRGANLRRRMVRGVGHGYVLSGG